MPLSSGAKLGPYEIQSPLGAGGMAEVYRARDTRLGRDVALKILPESFSHESDRLHRFEQEARAVAALNHPNILAVFDIGESNGAPYLVSELLEGETLRVVLDRGAIAPRRAIDYAVQIAQGLAAAHEKGIVHRDLKPENVFVTKDARVKILDFGLAKVAQRATAATSDGATMTSSHTAMGVVMGTASYMAPEQVRGEQVDARTDIFAFGALLHEMVSGHRAFRRDTAAETMTAVLKEDPPELTDTGRPVPPSLDRIVRRCLEKRPEQRFQSAKDLSFALSALSGTDSSAAARIVKAQTKVPAWLWAAAGLLVVVGALLTWFVTNRSTAEPPMQFAIPLSAEVSHLALSPDNSMLAFVSTEENSGLPVIYIQRVGSPEARAVPGTDGASYPFWSPHSDYLGFFANGKLQKVAVAGGAPQVLANVWAARGGSWSKNDVILFEPDSGTPLWRINADGSGLAQVTDKLFTPDEQSHRWPVFLPDGNHFLFWAGSFVGAQDDRSSGIYLSSLDGKEKKLVVLAHSSFALGSGHMFYADYNGHLVSVPFDSNKGTTTGSAGVSANFVSLQPSTYYAALTASPNGTLVYSASSETSLSILTWMDRSGKVLTTLSKPAVQCNPTLSPDGARVAVDISDQKAANVDIWLENTLDAGSSRFTFDPAEEVVGVWSRDGKMLAYRSAGGGSGRGSLIVKAANGLERGKAILEFAGNDDVIPNSWSADDRQILCTRQTSNGAHLEVSSVGEEKSRVFQPSNGNQVNGMISPDGKWAAYASDESGTWEIYVTTFPGAEGKWQVSRGGGKEPRWGADGKEIFYLAPGGMLTAVSVSTINSFATGTPTPLFQFHGRAVISSTDVFSYDVSKDGKRFLVNRYVKPERIEPLTIVLHAASEK
ncbi:MAG TPA: protein kinase [Terriglobales bacterium]|nr:protein kinase [Terriglobales bacterium]